MNANLWKSGQVADQKFITALKREIATKLGQPNGYVFFHYDGDRRFGERHTSENVDKFAGFRVGIEQLLRGAPGFVNSSEAEIRATMTKLVEVVPFYSIESWLYQNAVSAKALCGRHHNGLHVKTFDFWALDRGLLDEVVEPKENCCLSDSHSKELAGAHFPTEEICAAHKSLCDVVNSVCASEGLQRALLQTTS